MNENITQGEKEKNNHLFNGRPVLVPPDAIEEGHVYMGETALRSVCMFG